MAEKRNQAYVRTHERIKNCLGELMRSKPMRQVTVGEICDAVGINRSTFYAHFTDVYAVAEAISDDLNNELGAKFADISQSGEPLEDRKYLVTMLEHMKEHRVFYRRLLADTESPVVVNNMKYLHRELVAPVFARYNLDGRIADYCFEFTLSGFFTIIGKWVNDGCPESTEELANLILNLMPRATVGSSFIDIFSGTE